MFAKSKWGLLIILIITIIAYSPILQADFIYYDDPEYVINNPYIKKFTLENVIDIFKAKATILYVPLTICSYYIDQFLFSGRATGFHLTNLIIHLLNIILIFKLLDLLKVRNELIFLILIFFGLNPLNTESVCWITERKDVLYMFFFLFSAIYYIKYLQNKFFKFYFVSFVFFIFSCLAKPMAITLPVILLIYTYFSERKIKMATIIKLVPFFLISFITSVISYFCIKNNSTGKLNISDYSFFQKGYLFISEVGYYFSKTFVPIKLSLFHFFPKATDLFTTGPLILFFFIGMSVLTSLYLLRKKKLVLSLILIWLILLLPILQIVPNTHSYVSDRYFYLSCVFPPLILFSIFEKAMSIKTLQNISIALLLCFSYLTFSHVKNWKNSETMFKYELNLNPNNGMANNNIGYYYNSLAKFKIANQFLKKAVASDSSNAYYLNNYAWSLAGSGKTDSSIIYFNKAIFRKKNYMEAHNNLGICYYTIGKSQEALREFKMAEKINNSHPEVLYNIGAYYLKENNNEIAKDYLIKAKTRGHNGAANLIRKYNL